MEMHERQVASFTAAFQELFPRAVRLAWRILGDRAAAEDVAAEALTRAFGQWDKISVTTSYRSGWVLRTTTNLAIDVVRKKPSAELPDDAELPYGRSDFFAVAKDSADEVALRLALVAALRELPERQREVVALRYLGDLTYSETATALGISSGTVARHVHRGLAGLRGQLRDLGRLEKPTVPADITIEYEGGIVKIASVGEAMELQGTDRLVQARVLEAVGKLGWKVDIGIPALLKTMGQKRGAPADLVGQDIECVVVHVDEANDGVLVTRPVSPEDEEAHQQRAETLAGFEVGDVRQGRVQSLVAFGAFVEVDGIHGLVHKSEIGDRQLSVGLEVAVEVLAIDHDLQRMSLRLR